MLWLIQTLIDYFRTYGLAVNRGDAPAFDFEIGDFTLDGNWHTLDLSALIPENATIVYLSGALRGSGINLLFFVRTKGHADAFNRSTMRTQNANIINDMDLVAFPNENLELEYLGAAVSIDLLRLTVKGWDF